MTKQPPSRRRSEHEEQAALISACRALSHRHPELGLLFAIPNGGHRHPAVAAKLKEEGVSPGVPDLLMPVARQGQHGLWIEMKAARGRLNSEQIAWADALTEQGYRVVVCWSAEQALHELFDYLGLPRKALR